MENLKIGNWVNVSNATKEEFFAMVEIAKQQFTICNNDDVVYCKDEPYLMISEYGDIFTDDKLYEECNKENELTIHEWLLKSNSIVIGAYVDFYNKEFKVLAQHGDRVWIENEISGSYIATACDVKMYNNNDKKELNDLMCELSTKINNDNYTAYQIQKLISMIKDIKG